MFEKVTIFGESAGSSSVNYQLLSPLSQGIFQRAIMQSGTVLGVSLLLPSFLVQVSWGSANTPEQAVSYGRELIQNLGCEVDTEVCMQNATVEAILQSTFLHGSDVDGLWQVGQMLSAFISRPHQAVDDSSFSSDPFLLGSPKDLLESGQFNTEVERSYLGSSYTSVCQGGSDPWDDKGRGDHLVA